MKAITIKQPWASLIVHGFKNIENRTWACPEKYIGHRVLIHASGKPVEMRNPNSVFTKTQWDSLPVEFQRKIICAEDIVNSAIIGSVEIIGCSINHPSKWAEKTDASKGYYENPIYKIQEPVSDGDHNVCMCRICVDEKVQVMSMGKYFVCKYCGGRWYK